MESADLTFKRRRTLEWATFCQIPSDRVFEQAVFHPWKLILLEVNVRLETNDYRSL